MIWGKHDLISNSTDDYAVNFPHQIHQNFDNYQDTILLIDKGEKQVSSTVGHNLMHGHPFASQRFEQANDNLSKIKDVLISGDVDAFIQIVESEALTLHAMMMTSLPYSDPLHRQALALAPVLRKPFSRAQLSALIRTEAA